MKRLFVPLDEFRCCADCKHRVKNEDGIFDECGIYKGRNSQDKLLIRKDRRRVWLSDCPLETGNLNVRGMFYYKKRIPL